MLTKRANELKEEQKNLTVKPSESAQVIAAHSKQRKGAGSANTLSQNQTNIILEAKLANRHKKTGVQGQTQGTSSDNRQKEKDEKNKKDMKDDDWLQKLVKVKDDYERQNEENQKLHREILKRNMRYQKNEQEYENKLALL